VPVEARGSIGSTGTRCRAAAQGGTGVRGIDGAPRSRIQQQLKEASESAAVMEHQEAEPGGKDGDGQREGDGGVLVMVRAPGSRGRGSTGVGVGGAGVGGGDVVAPRSRVREWRWPKRG
jgi:hypothetical protein